MSKTVNSLYKFLKESVDLDTTVEGRIPDMAAPEQQKIQALVEFDSDSKTVKISIAKEGKLFVKERVFPDDASAKAFMERIKEGYDVIPDMKAFEGKIPDLTKDPESKVIQTLTEEIVLGFDTQKSVDILKQYTPDPEAENMVEESYETSLVFINDAKRFFYNGVTFNESRFMSFVHELKETLDIEDRMSVNEFFGIKESYKPGDVVRLSGRRGTGTVERVSPSGTVVFVGGQPYTEKEVNLESAGKDPKVSIKSSFEKCSRAKVKKMKKNERYAGMEGIVIDSCEPYVGLRLRNGSVRYFLSEELNKVEEASARATLSKLQRGDRVMATNPRGGGKGYVIDVSNHNDVITVQLDGQQGTQTFYADEVHLVEKVVNELAAGNTVMTPDNKKAQVVKVFDTPAGKRAVKLKMEDGTEKTMFFKDVRMMESIKVGSRVKIGDPGYSIHSKMTSPYQHQTGTVKRVKGSPARENYVVYTVEFDNKKLGTNNFPGWAVELAESSASERVAVKVTFDNGDSLVTEINTDLEGAKQYYLGKSFNIGQGENDLMAKAVKVELAESAIKEESLPMPKYIDSIWDFGDEEDSMADRYTVVLKQEYSSARPPYRDSLGFSEGGRAVSQWGEAAPGEHLGTQLNWEDLSPENQQHVVSRLSNMEEAKRKASEGKMVGWRVILNGKEIDTVFYDASVDAEEVKQGLVDHDGYDPGIRVVRESTQVNEVNMDYSEWEIKVKKLLRNAGLPEDVSGLQHYNDKYFQSANYPKMSSFREYYDYFTKNDPVGESTDKEEKEPEQQGDDPTKKAKQVDTTKDSETSDERGGVEEDPIKQPGTTADKQGKPEEAEEHSADQVKDMGEAKVDEAGLGEPIFSIENIDEVKNTIKEGINAPLVSVQHSTLGGPDRVSILITVAMDPKEDWPYGILENSRYLKLHLLRSGELELVSQGHTLPARFRKVRVKSVQDVVKKINDFIAKAGTPKNESRVNEYDRGDRVEFVTKHFGNQQGLITAAWDDANGIRYYEISHKNAAGQDEVALKREVEIVKSLGKVDDDELRAEANKATDLQAKDTATAADKAKDLGYPRPGMAPKEGVVPSDGDSETDKIKKLTEAADVESQLRAIVQDYQMASVKFEKGTSKVDAYTASAVIKLIDALAGSDSEKSKSNLEKIRGLLSTKAGLLKVANIAFSMMESKDENARFILDEDYSYPGDEKKEEFLKEVETALADADIKDSSLFVTLENLKELIDRYEDYVDAEKAKKDAGEAPPEPPMEGIDFEKASFAQLREYIEKIGRSVVQSAKGINGLPDVSDGFMKAVESLAVGVTMMEASEKKLLEALPPAKEDKE